MRHNLSKPVLLVLVFAACAALAQEQPPNQRVFESPDAAANAFVAACEANDTKELIAIFGPLFAAETGRVDESEQRANRAKIAELAKQIQRLEERSDSQRVLLL